VPTEHLRGLIACPDAGLGPKAAASCAERVPFTLTTDVTIVRASFGEEPAGDIVEESAS
jgi:hypothetical protein